MPDWVNGEGQREQPPRPLHAGTEVVPVGWQPVQYDPAEHKSRLAPRLPADDPGQPRGPQRAFAPEQPQQSQYLPRWQQPQHGHAWQSRSEADSWVGSVQGGAPQYPRQQPMPPVTQRGYAGQSPPQGHYTPQQPAWQQPYQLRYAPTPEPRQKRRVFLWVFLAIQALFLIWIIAGVASHPAGPTAAQQAAQQCANNGWYPLFKSQADCQQHYAVALNDAGNVGKGIGVAFIVIIWMVVDFFLGLGYGIYRLASRR